MKFRKYKRLGYAEMIPWDNTIDMSRVSVSQSDLENGSPKIGDMIAVNSKSHDDQWLVAEKYFNDNFNTSKSLTFGDALEALKQGERVARMGWTSKGMYIFLISSEANGSAIHDYYGSDVGNEDDVICLPSIGMYTIDSSGCRALFNGWLASQTDMLSDDWVIV